MSWVLGWVGYLIKEHLFATYMCVLVALKKSPVGGKGEPLTLFLINIKGLELYVPVCAGGGFRALGGFRVLDGAKTIGFYIVLANLAPPAMG